MPSSYSPNLKIELISTGEQTDAWGDTTNDNFTNVFEQAITGKTIAIFPSDADYNWGASFVNTVNSQPQRNLFVEVAGTLSTTRNFIVPTINKPYLIYNNTLGGQSIVVKTLAGTGVTVPNGQKTYVYANGTDVIESFNYFPALRAGSATLDTALPVTSGGTGQVTIQAAINSLAGAVTSGFYLRGNGTNVVMSAIQAADVPTLNQNTTGSAAALSGGAANRIPYNTAAAATSFIAAPTIASTYLQWDGANFAWATVSGGVTTFSGGTTGLTPAVATSGAITLAGTLAVANGGTGVTTSTGSGSVVLSTSPTLVTPTLGVATATSINKVALTAPATAATLTIADGKTLTANKTITFTTSSSDGYTYTLPTANATLAGLSINQSWTGTNNFSSSAISSKDLLLGIDNLSNHVLRFGNSTSTLLPSRTTGDNNILYGSGASITSGSRNIVIARGNNASSLTTGSDNTIIGYGLSTTFTSGTFNINIGNSNLGALVAGNRNVVLGNEAASSLRSNSGFNIIIGDNAAGGLNNNTVGNNHNIAIGYNGMGRLGDGDNNIAIGKTALYGASGGTASNQICIGTETGYELDGNPLPNIFIGNFAGRNASTSQSNVLIGESAAKDLDTGDNNVYLGYESGKLNSYQTTNVICIGYQAEPSATGVSNQITLGNGSIATLRCQVTTITALSDERDKKDIVDIPAGLEFINTVRPVSFVWDTRDGSKVDVPEFGFIAQQLQKAQQDTGVTVPNLVYEVSEDRLEAAPGTLLPVMVKAIQELSQQVEALKKELAALRG